VIRAIVDTNVFVSALLSPLGNEAFIVMAIQQGLIKPYFSDEMIEEYVKVLARPKFSFPPDEIHALIDLIRSRGEQISHSQPLSLHSPDPADDKFLACAVTAAADFIVKVTSETFLRKCAAPSALSAPASFSRGSLLRCDR
jgi:putative PIN family toxin of toxin-antitoxin system